MENTMSRQNGYYWVQFETAFGLKWVIAEWTHYNGDWYWQMGVGYSRYADNSFAKIDEQRIKHRSER